MPLRDRLGNPTCWLQGVLIVLSLLGHDLLMASPAPVAAAAPTAGEIHQHTLTHVVVEVTAALPHNHPELPHPSVCGVGGAALFPSVNQPATPDLHPAVAIAPSYFPTSAHIGTLLREEPYWPPSTRRALLQVYRI